MYLRPKPSRVDFQSIALGPEGNWNILCNVIKYPVTPSAGHDPINPDVPLVQHRDLLLSPKLPPIHFNYLVHHSRYLARLVTFNGSSTGEI